MLLLVLALASGCVGSRPVKVETNNGLRIDEFVADPQIASFNDNVLFTASIENVGGTSASDVKLTLFGIENIWRVPPNRAAEKEDTEKDWGKELFDPPVPSQNMPGDLKVSAKTFLPPVLPEGMEKDYSVTARVTFNYSTAASIVVPMISKSLLKIKSDKGESIESAPRITNSDGPLKIGLSKGTVPVVVDNTLDEKQKATFVIDIINAGNGFPMPQTNDASKLGMLKGSIDVSGTGVAFSKNGCMGFEPSSINPNRITFDSDTDLMKLRQDGRLPLSCTLEIDRSAFTPTTSGIISLSVKMSYTYFIEKALSVHVMGTKKYTPSPAGSQQK